MRLVGFEITVEEMFNFIDPNLSPKVVCTSPAMDNYEADNLISNNFADKSRGFIVYPAIKPPVEIEFEFICPVNINYISLNTSVGSQKCNGIEIFAKSKEIDHTTICKAVFDSPGIIFGNSRKYSKKNLPENSNKNFEIRAFKSDTFKIFSNATGMKIVIFRTEKSVPCLGSVEVWGEPSKSCSKVTVETIMKLATKSSVPYRGTTSDESPVNEIRDELSVPDDFKDDLTCEIMLLPMTLPSGKSIDRSTLDKHIQSEKSFGRKPCDPFTGIKFTGTLKPVLNVALKSRIDMFILQNSHREEFSNLTRTLGGRRSECKILTDRKRKSSDDTATSDSSKTNMTIVNLKTNSNISSEIDHKTICVKCKTELTNFLYKISCGHYYCRNCLLQIICEISECEICKRHFTTNEVEKVFL